MKINLSVFKPSVGKLALTIALPLAVVLIYTGSLDTLPDFYGYLLSPTMQSYENGQMHTRFNNYVLLWIPLYVAACAVAWVLGKAT